MIMVRESGDAAPDVIECRHGLTPPMRDARKRRFRRERDLNVIYSFVLNIILAYLMPLYYLCVCVLPYLPYVFILRFPA